VTRRTTTPQQARLISRATVAAAILMGTIPSVSTGASLRASSSSLDRQNQQAQRHDFTFIVTRSQLERFVQRGYLVRVRENDDFRLHGVSFPYARPQVKLFIERLSSQYRAACGQQLVITSLTRPKNYQPRNASPRSVHPTGMAIDMRRPNNWTCRSWLESVLVTLEAEGVLEANLERRPPHYHVAVFPQPYARYVENLSRNPKTVATYLVSRGDTLTAIARRHRTSVDVVKAKNGLRSDRIYAGQLLEVPLVD
jgi:hypothetical protein